MKSKIPLKLAGSIAMEVAAQLGPTTKRLVIAGSIRRCKPEIGDIEMVIEPTLETYALLDQWLATGKALHRENSQCWGAKARSMRWPMPDSSNVAANYIQIDMFLQPDPATWGCNMFLRTGSAEFNMNMFRKRNRGGWMPDYLNMHDARIWAGIKALDTPDEESIFALWGMEPVDPTKRTENYRPQFGELPTVEIEELPTQAGLF